MANLIDTARLTSEFAGDEEILAELREAFLGELPKMMSAIEAAIKSSDAKALEHSAHTLKGAVANFQAPAVKEAAFVLEKQGREGALVNAADNFGKLSTLMTELTAELDKLFSKAA